MALAFTNLTSGQAATQTATTASVAFANNTLYILSVGANWIGNHPFSSGSGSGAGSGKMGVGIGIQWVGVHADSSV